MPVKATTVHKTVALILALAKLHNFCILDEKEAHCNVGYGTAIDEWQNKLTDAVPLVETQQQEECTKDRQEFGHCYPLPVA
jgi:hypothetical protein